MLIPLLLLLLLSSCLVGAEDILFTDKDHKITLQDYAVYSSNIESNFKVYVKKKHDDYSTEIVIHNTSDKPKRAKVRIYFTNGSGGDRLLEAFPDDKKDGERIEAHNILVIQVMTIRPIAPDMDSPKSFLSDAR